MTDQFRPLRKALALLSHDMMPDMKLVTSALKIGITSVREFRRPQVKLPLLSSKLKRRLLEETLELLRLKASTRFPIWSARFTLRNTILKSRPMCSAHGFTSKTQAFALSMTVQLERIKCSSLITPIHFVWERASTLPRSLMILQAPSAASAKMSHSPRTKLSPESEIYIKG